jgi:hypothetical protein
MKWFRSNIKHGSRLALLALAIQFALSFGHFHGAAAQATPAIQAGVALSDPADAGGVPSPVAADQSVRPQAPANDDSDRSSNDPCAICAVIALASSVLFATPPHLLLPQAIEFLYLAAAAEFVDLNSVLVAFQPRAPPVS